METSTSSPGLVMIKDKYAPLSLIFSGTPRSFSIRPFLRHRSSPISRSASHSIVSPPLLTTLCSSYSPPLQKYPEHWQYADSGLELLFFTPKPALVQKPIMILLFPVLSIFIVYFFRLVWGISASVMKLQHPISPSLSILAELTLIFVRVQYGICRFQKWCAMAGLQTILPKPPFYLSYKGLPPWNSLRSCSISLSLFYRSPASYRRCLDCCSSISFLILPLNYLSICLLACACSYCSLAVLQNCSRIYLCIFSLICSNFFLLFSRQAFCPLRARLRRSDSLFILASFSISSLFTLYWLLRYSLLIFSNLRSTKSKGVTSSFFRTIFTMVCFFSPAFSQKQMKFNTPLSSKTIFLNWLTRQRQVSYILLGRHLKSTASVMSIKAFYLQYLSNVSVSYTQIEMNPP